MSHFDRCGISKINECVQTSWWICMIIIWWMWAFPRDECVPTLWWMCAEKIDKCVQGCITRSFFDSFCFFTWWIDLEAVLESRIWQKLHTLKFIPFIHNYIKDGLWHMIIANGFWGWRNSKWINERLRMVLDGGAIRNKVTKVCAH